MKCNKIKIVYVARAYTLVSTVGAIVQIVIVAYTDKNVTYMIRPLHLQLHYNVLEHRMQYTRQYAVGLHNSWLPLIRFEFES